MKASILIFIVCAIICTGCSTGYVVSEHGDEADAVLNNGIRFTAEIFVINDSSVIFSKLQHPEIGKPLMFYAYKQDIASITIKGYDGESWFPYVLIFQVIPAALLTAAYVSVNKSDDATSVAFAALAPAFVTSLFFAGSDVPAPEWNNKSPVDKFDDLKIYAKFPEGLSDEQLEQMLNNLRIKEIPKI